MITDEIVEAIEKLTGMMEETKHRFGANSVLAMLCEFDDTQWLQMNQEERKLWLEQFLP